MFKFVLTAAPKLALLMLVVGSSSLSASWPRFNGPHGDNVSRETGLLKAWPQCGPKLLWTAEGIGEGFSSVSVAGGRIYTSGNLRDKTAITALDMDGKILWQAPGGEAWTGTYPGTRGTPTVDGGRIYNESPLGQVVCLDARTGRLIWEMNILEEFEAKNITWALSESLLLDGERLICCPGGEHAGVVALNKNDGELVWAAKPTGDLAGYASPTLIKYRGLRIVLAMTQKGLIGVNAETGELLFRHIHETRYDANAVAPLYNDGHIFITSGYRAGSEMLRLEVEGKKAPVQKVSVQKVWESKDLDNSHGGVVLVDGCIHGSAHQARNTRQTPWVCLDWKNGRTKYSAQGVGQGSITAADGMVYTLSEKGRLGLVKAGPASHCLVSCFQLPEKGKGPVWAHPVVCDGRLYIRHGDVLYAYDIRRQ